MLPRSSHLGIPHRLTDPHGGQAQGLPVVRTSRPTVHTGRRGVIMARLSNSKLRTREAKGVRVAKSDKEKAQAFLDSARKCGDRRTAARLRRAIQAGW